MLTLLASLLGFVSSALPKLLNLWQNQQDKRHELAIMDKQLMQMRLGHQQQLEEIKTQAEIANTQALYQYESHSSGVRWVEGLRATVRPVVTYLLVLLFIAVKGAVVVACLQQGLTLATCMQGIWDDETASLFAAVIGFWFGNRTFK